MSSLRVRSTPSQPQQSSSLGKEKEGEATKRTPYDPRLTSKFDNTALACSLGAMLISLALATANFIALVAPALNSSEFQTFNLLVLYANVALFLAAFSDLFVIVFAVPGSMLKKFKGIAAVGVGICAVIEVLIAGVYGIQVLKSAGNRESSAFIIVAIDVVCSWLFVGIPFIVLVWSRFWKEDVKKSKRTGDRTQVKKYVL
jgi:hypothetical protein